MGEWDEQLFAGPAPFYVRGRLPYRPGLAAALRAALRLDGRGTLVDVGAGPGPLTLLLADAFARVEVVEPDPGMVEQGRAAALAAGVTNVAWQVVPAERMRPAPASVDVVAFGQSFHWVDQRLVAALVRAAAGPLTAVVPGVEVRVWTPGG